MSDSQQTAPFDYIIFGATGDLMMRKLIPALYNQLRVGHVPEEARIIGSARSKLDNEEYRQRAREALNRFLPDAHKDADLIERFLKKIQYIAIDSTKYESNWGGLKEILAQSPDDRIRVFYYSTAPQLFEAISENLHAHGLITKQSRVVLEKPIGTNSETARAINDGVSRFFEEGQIFRIDHYLGKETVQDIIALRFANPLLQAVWSGEYIKSIQITAAETVGVEGRAAYYDTSGALRDMIQNHLLQVLSLCAMEAPSSLEADAIRDAKVNVLKALRPIPEDAVSAETVRAQYVQGTMNGEKVPGYLEELGEESHTETYAAMRAYVDTPRWKNTPFYIRTAKRSAHKLSEVVVTFKEGTSKLFGGTPGADRLVIRLQPNEGFGLSINVKNPSAAGFGLQRTALDGRFAPADGSLIPDSYERLMLDAVRGYPALFIRRDEVEAAWAWVEPTLNAWAADKAPMGHYAAGSYGPEQARQFTAQTGDQWHEDMAD
ncbi:MULTISPECIES: glucose-6-phosphate dehydrogenase [unclassified Saccharibacter]|uniref:glucose-6-phosphate dehydrogenase n=1 Tax=unclassified Saccharibacter TaxID=2648722 RepID=UPI00132B27C4|nr:MULTISPECIES: glucose-6-phosphate dehydrogenase [unclassified Saccharibacter]MXV35483.1 glucose-6-phosphate dehydrogenase [Saccharibacter sp. EH611]MXV58143.1 glucose-6-phosphate dehydrogenase [Saccharibacter sp. EH70]MXV65417.1 glucose-6-phosphate dehydrogenase [Saccharibacter sp. EH60]